MHPSISSGAVLLSALLALSAGARADPAEPCGGAEQAAAPVAPAPLPRAEQSLGAAAADAQLDSARGGSDLTTIDTKLNGTVGGNSATNVTTGSNIIDSGSFANMSGIPIVVQNTGANVLIQNATVINLQLK